RSEGSARCTAKRCRVHSGRARHERRILFAGSPGDLPKGHRDGKQGGLAVSRFGKYRAPFRRFTGGREMVRPGARFTTRSPGGSARLGPFNGGQGPTAQRRSADEKTAATSPHAIGKIQVQG